MTEWKKVQEEVPENCEGCNYSEDIAFITQDGEVHNGFYADYSWFDIDENSVYLTPEVTEWIYLKDIEESDNEREK